MSVPGLKVEAASPCSVNWDSMSGDARARHCALCQLQVFNLSGLTEAEVAALLAKKTDASCSSYFQRPDGTVMASDCPVGLLGVPQRTQPRSKLRIAAGLALGLVVSSVAGVEIFHDNIRRMLGHTTNTPAGNWRPTKAPPQGDVDFAYQRSTTPRRDPFAEPDPAPQFRRDPFVAPERSR